MSFSIVPFLEKSQEQISRANNLVCSVGITSITINVTRLQHHSVRETQVTQLPSAFEGKQLNNDLFKTSGCGHELTKTVNPLTLTRLSL